MVDRRKFLSLATAVAAAPLLPGRTAMAADKVVLKTGGEGYSQFSGTQFSAVPSICGQCPSQCAIIGYLDEGRLVKIEGQPDSIRSEGKVCAKGQAGAAKVDDPDRILHPMRRVGARGAGEWQQITWEVALEELRSRLSKLRDEGRPEAFVFHHGWISASAEHLIDEVFLPAYGSASVVRQTCHGQSARWTGHELTWGGYVDSWDFDNTRFVLNFGSNVLEAHTNHVSLARRLTRSATERHIRMVTFDVRLSNTAAKSDLWLPIKPGTDLAVVLAMCNVIMNEGLYRGAGEAFLEFCRVTPDADASLEDKVKALLIHLAEYTPQWAEQISGVAADRIVALAKEFASSGPACVISSRGAAAHYNGAETERAIQMLAAITGNIDVAGGRCSSVTPEWIFPSGPEDLPPAKRLSSLVSVAAESVLPEFGAGTGLLRRIKAGGERPGVYLWYHLNPAYSNGDTVETIEILKDESVLPFTVAVTPFYDESAALADLILPDATYIERYEIEAGSAPGQVPEYALRQPLVAPRGESRDFQDVCCEIAETMGFPLGFKSSEEFVEAACRLTPDVKRKARGFRGLKARGVWHDNKAAPTYGAYRTPVSEEAVSEDGVILDEITGVYWNWRQAGLASEDAARAAGYQGTPGAARAYVAQRIGDAVYAGFKPGRINKSGLFELYSAVLAARNQAPLPTYIAIPEHVAIRADQLVLTTFKVNVQTLSGTGNSAWLSEIYHDNAAWINPLTAAARGIVHGDLVTVSSAISEINVSARVTPAVAPDVIAISTHTGRWQGGRYAADRRAPFAADDAHHDAYKWWQPVGGHVNRIIPNLQEPVSGQQTWMDTLVTVAKA